MFLYLIHFIPLGASIVSLSPEGLLQVITLTDPPTQGEKSGGLTPVPVCADGWSDTLAAQACSLLGARY